MRTALKRGFFLTLAFYLCGAALLSLLTLLAPLDARLDTPSHFAPLYLAFAVFAAICAVFARGRVRVVILGAAVAVAVSATPRIMPELLRADGSAAAFDPAGQLKIIQINALRSNADIERVAAWLDREAPDIISVNEARHDLRGRLFRAGWKAAGAHGADMIFTRDAYVVMNRPKPKTGSEVTFVNATYARALGPVEVMTTHVGWPTRRTTAGQYRQLEEIVADLPTRRLILAGDFNATPWSASLQRLDRRLGLTRRDRATATWPAQVLGHRWPWPFLPIDHVYAGPEWVTIRVERGPWLGSDHYPLIVTLAPRRP